MKLVALLTSLSLLTTACAGDETVARYGAADRVWTLKEFNGMPFEWPATLIFSKRGKLSGATPCNTFEADNLAPYPWFEAKNMQITARSCTEVHAEAAYLRALSLAEFSEVLDDTLMLTAPGIELVFKADE